MTTTGATPRGRKRNHPVHELFSFSETGNESKCLVTACKAKIPGKHSGNLLKHIKIHHKEQHAALVKEKDGRHPAPKRARQQVLNGVQMSGQALQMECLRLVTEHGHAFSLLDDDAFQRIIQPMIAALPASDKVVIGSNTIPTLIPTYVEKVRKKIAAEVRGRLVCLKVDATSKNNRHFLGVNIQFIHSSRIVVRTLGVVELFTKHMAANIKLEVMQLLELYNIPVENILSFTTDNGANMLKAAHLLREEAGAHHMEESAYLEDEDDSCPECELLSANQGLLSVRCAAHTAQLAVDDSVKATPSLKPLLDGSRKLAKYLRTPTMARRLKREKLPLPCLDVNTRWGSSYDMMKSIQKLKLFVEEVFSENEQKTYNLTDDQWKELDAALAALEPVRKLTIALQSENLLIGDFFAQWVRCKLRLRFLQDHTNNALAQTLRECMEKTEKSEHYKDGGEKKTPLFEYPGFSAALFLDPRFFSFLEPEDVNEAKNYLVKLWTRLEKLAQPDVSEVNTSTDVPSSSASDDEDDELQQLLMENNAERYIAASQETAKKNIRPMLDTYFLETKQLKTKTNVLQYWHDQRLVKPEIFLLASTVLAIPATQVSVERLFSALRYVLNPLRFNLSAENVDSVMVLHSNSNVVRDMACEALNLQVTTTPKTKTVNQVNSDDNIIPSTSTTPSPSVSLELRHPPHRFPHQGCHQAPPELL